MKQFKYVSLLLITTLLMGIAFPVGKIGFEYAPPFFLMGIRFVIAGGLLALLVRSKPQPRPRGTSQWWQAAVIGLFQSAGVMGCGYYSMRWITSGESSIMLNLNPLFVIILGTLFTGAVYRVRQWLGVVVGFLGVAFCLNFQLGFQPGTLLSMAGAIFFAIATLLIKRWDSAFQMTTLAAYQMIFGGIALLLLSALTEHPYFRITTMSISILLWLVVMCSIVQFSLWYYLLKNGDPAKTSAYLFLVPLFGVLSSWLLLHETIEWYVIVGGAFICAGIFLVNWQGTARAKVQVAPVRTVEKSI
ncbi:UNVERIFIED_CONTAM: drug/metabolite transporter (DMT)-like permease [Brevibacillus sp. OAP136]